MKELICFSPGETARFIQEDGEHLSSELFAECQRRFPLFFPNNPNIMEVSGTKDDPALNEVIAFLREHGREPWLKRYPSAPWNHPELFFTQGRRIFEPEDHAKAQYFVIDPQEVILKDAEKDDEGRLLIKRSDVKSPPIGISLRWPRTIVCKESLRVAMEKEGFVGLAFRPVEVVGRKPPDEPLWIVTSDREMPPLLNRIVHADGTDYAPGTLLGCYVDDYYSPPLLRFSAEQLREMKPFAVAVTKERQQPKMGRYFAGDPEKVIKKYNPWIIASRVFREWCEERKLKIEWWPVELE